MKALGIVCSPRKGGNTEILMQEALTGVKDCGAKAELLAVYNKDIKPCDGCSSCEKTGKCHIKDDMQEIYLKLLDADAIIWSTPVYFCSTTAQAKIIIDRSYALYSNSKLTNKVGGVISVGGSVGNSSVWSLFSAFFSAHRMFSADFVSGYAGEKGDIRKDKHAMKAARELGRQIILIAERKFQYPEEYDVPIYRFVKREYDIDMCPARGRFGD